MNTLKYYFLLAVCFFCTGLFSQQPEMLFNNSGFELESLENWQAEGDAFANQPVKGDNVNARNKGKSGQIGGYWIGTYEKYTGKEGKPGDISGDSPKGTLKSVEFTINQPYINFVIGGGDDPDALGVKLLCGNFELFLATGHNKEEMRALSANVSTYNGKKAQIVIYDQSTDGWGHINVDNFTASNQPVGEIVVPVQGFLDKGEKVLALTNRYINLPLPGNKTKVEVTLSVGNISLGKYYINKKKTPADFAYIDLAPFAGQGVSVSVSGYNSDIENTTNDSTALGNSPAPMASQVAVDAFQPNGIKMIHTPSVGKMWDPSILWHNGWYYMYAMHNMGKGDYGMWGAKSDDGVHWQELGPVIKDAPFIVFKMFVMHNGKYFIAAHGSFSKRPGHQNDMQRHWRSLDGINWEYMGDSTDTYPDPRWHQITERWDCMYMVPNENGKGYMGYTVATELDRNNRGFGRLRSDDGYRWEVLPPVPFDWKGLVPGYGEFAGLEKIGDKYYTISGRFGIQELGLERYCVCTFVSSSPEGPFSPDKGAYMLCGGTGPAKATPHWLAALGRAEGNEIIISNYVGTKGWGPDVTMLPIKKAVIDTAGHLRQGYWKNNDAAKGTVINIAPKVEVNATQGYNQVLLDQAFDFNKGIIVEGVIRSFAQQTGASAGFYIGQAKNGEGIGINLGIGSPMVRSSYIGLLRELGDITMFDPVDYISGPPAYRRAGLGVANINGLNNNATHTFRLWVRQGLFELYVDDIIVQTFFTGQTNGKIGFIGNFANVQVNNLKCWQMNID